MLGVTVTRVAGAAVSVAVTVALLLPMRATRLLRAALVLRVALLVGVRTTLVITAVCVSMAARAGLPTPMRMATTFVPAATSVVALLRPTVSRRCVGPSGRRFDREVR